MRPLFPPPSDEQGRVQNKGRRAASQLTRNGQAKLQRRTYRVPGQGNVRPSDDKLGRAEGPAVSRSVRALACLLNMHAGSFKHAAECLHEAAHLEISRESLRQVVEAEGQALIQAQQQRLKPSWDVEDARLADGRSRLYVGCDGVNVPTITDAEKRKRREGCVKKRRARKRKDESYQPAPLKKRSVGTKHPYREFKLAIHYDESVKHSHASITRHRHRMAQMLMSRDARKLGLHRADEKIGVVDGADWIRGRMRDAGLNLDAVGLDFYHLAEHVHEARRRCFGEENAAGDGWASALLHRVKHEGYSAMRDQLVDERRGMRGRRRQAIDKLLSYIEPRREMIQYPHFRSKGWQIGSGPTEASCKTLTARLKRSGMRWNPENADALANLAAMHQNGQTKAYWRQAV